MADDICIEYVLGFLYLISAALCCAQIKDILAIASLKSPWLILLDTYLDTVASFSHGVADPQTTPAVGALVPELPPPTVGVSGSSNSSPLRQDDC